MPKKKPDVYSMTKKELRDFLTVDRVTKAVTDLYIERAASEPTADESVVDALAHAIGCIALAKVGGMASDRDRAYAKARCSLRGLDTFDRAAIDNDVYTALHLLVGDKPEGN